MNRLASDLFALGSDVRYVATYRSGLLELHQREGLSLASAAESDKYEELLVNPTVLTMLSRRGEIDCGGLSYVLVRYGNFFQLVVPVQDGHVSVALEPSADPSVSERALAMIRGATSE